MKTRTPTKCCARCGRALTDRDICWTVPNTRNARVLTYCDPCFFAKRTHWREKVWSGLFEAPYGEWPPGNPSTDP